MKATIESETKRRTDLVEDVNFRTICAKAAREMGFTAKEWNDNKAIICLFFANEVCAIENKTN